MTRRPKFIIRKQRAEHVRDGRQRKWCAACQWCGRAAMDAQWAAVLQWANGHRCVKPVRFAGITIAHNDLVHTPDLLSSPGNAPLAPLRSL